MTGNTKFSIATFAILISIIIYSGALGTMASIDFDVCWHNNGLQKKEHALYFAERSLNDRYIMLTEEASGFFLTIFLGFVTFLPIFIGSTIRTKKRTDVLPITFFLYALIVMITFMHAAPWNLAAYHSCDRKGVGGPVILYFILLPLNCIFVFVLAYILELIDSISKPKPN